MQDDDLVSGRELIDAGFAEDVELAATIDSADAVPVLEGGVFRMGGGAVRFEGVSVGARAAETPSQ